MYRGIHPSGNHLARRVPTFGSAEHAIGRDASGPTHISGYLPKLRLRVRTVPIFVWRDGAWRMEWIVLSHPEVVHVASGSLARPITAEGRRP